MIASDTDLVILDCYEEAWHTEADVYLLWGGRDKGASHFIAQRLIIDSLDDSQYFRCPLIRKTFESVKDSQYQTLKDVSESIGLYSEIRFLKSPLEIHPNHNNNLFLARGCDKSDRIKSLKDPNVTWLEEADQITEQDYIIIHTTMRHPTARVRQWLSFNSDFYLHPGMADYTDHWIWKFYLSKFDDPYRNGIHEIEIEIEKEDGSTSTEVLKVYNHHGTYKQNPYCPPKRRAVYEGLKDTNPYYYQVYAKGVLGKKTNDNPWAWALSRDKHYTPKEYQVNKNYPLTLSWDFNHDPCTVIVAQQEIHLPRFNIIGYYKASSSHESAIKQLCDRIRTEYPFHYRTKQMTITGDASGKQRDPSRPSNLNRYTDICTHLGLGRSSVMIEKANLPHKSSRDLCNDILHQIPKGGYLFYGGKGCEMLLSEIESAFPDDKESLNKAKKELGLHGLDAWRYLNGLWFAYHLVGARFKEYQGFLGSIVSRLKKQ